MDKTDTLSGQIEILRTAGYIEDFNLREDCIECRSGEFKLLHDDFVVDDVFRFEGDSDPADQAILYAISSIHTPLKGILVNGYGIYTDKITDALAKKLTIYPE